MLRRQLLLAVRTAATTVSRQSRPKNPTFSRFTTSIASSSHSPRSPEVWRASGEVESHTDEGFDPYSSPAALTIAPQHPRTHGIPVAVLHLRSHEPELLELFIHFVLHAAYALNMPVSRAAYLPTKRSLYTVIRGPFAHKKSQENFEKVVHKRAIKVWDTHPDVLGKWIKYLEINLLGGVGMRIVRWERTAIGFGRTHLSHLETERQLHAGLADEEAGRIQQLAESIIRAEMEAAASAREADQGSDGKSEGADVNESSPPTSQSSLDSDSSGRSTTEASARENSAEADIKSEEKASAVERTDSQPNDKR
ncbi:hypothetical protein BS47DRAFT_1353434 [Hydnum rufescens UP504]|uniref:Small ribosomal subunit protein uS10 domain-containing protein n=1 Tax=Hydnum rufescens UP504 TaxID=1448309 RepID=A0A9P6AHJ7_9AGAM|nr:hypothetical protein BS47DRAFT_1353434 [Hydnum rufescens UP504]